MSQQLKIKVLSNKNNLGNRIFFAYIAHVLGQKKYRPLLEGGQRKGGWGEGLHGTLYDRTEMCLKKVGHFFQDQKKLVTSVMGGVDCFSLTGDILHI